MPYFHYQLIMYHLINVNMDNPLFGADLNQVKRLVEAGHSVNALANNRFLLLNKVMSEKRDDVFDYLMSLDEIDVNRADLWNGNPLKHLIVNCFDEYFARRLIEKGTNIHFVDEIDHCGFLSLLAVFSKRVDTLSIGHLLIEKGADVNQQDREGKTALTYACKSGSFDWVCMLLCYGADVTIIATDEEGLLPLVSVSRNMHENERFLLEEILFNYTFDDDTTSVHLPSLVKAMTNDSDLFVKMFDKLSDVDYDLEDLHFVANMLVQVKVKNLKIFMRKFSHVIQEMVDKLLLLDELIFAAAYSGPDEFEEVFNFFLQSSYVADFVQSSVPETQVVAQLTEIFRLEYRNPEFDNNEEETIRNAKIYEETLTKMICLMLSYGLTVTARDLDEVYYYFEYSELFQILLHMDIEKISSGYRIAAIYYNPLLTIDFFYTRHGGSRLLDYFNDCELKKSIIDDTYAPVASTEKAKNLPHIPLLVELSRNAARRYIVDRFNIKTSVQFHTILKMLPIGDMNRKIIAFEKKLY